MHPVVRALGKVLRLVGISSPEDAEARKKSDAEQPSWKTVKVSVDEPAAVEAKRGE